MGLDRLKEFGSTNRTSGISAVVEFIGGGVPDVAGVGRSWDGDCVETE